MNLVLKIDITMKIFYDVYNFYKNGYTEENIYKPYRIFKTRMIFEKWYTGFAEVSKWIFGTKSILGFPDLPKWGTRVFGPKPFLGFPGLPDLVTGFWTLGRIFGWPSRRFGHHFNPKKTHPLITMVTTQKRRVVQPPTRRLDTLRMSSKVFYAETQK